ncbi:hypothetical protein HGRIS_007806 [Hohenbuehelia grisea]|uniref:Uncharacterized protein n=1 Tax=Hohenbuehelia grisea TaxID=104357 RepID=A0ABR3J6C7_9AGAR
MPSPSPPPLRYNLRWLDETFASSATTEALLSLQRENGNLTTHDYELATDFLPGIHKYFPRGYASAAGTASFLYGRHRSLTRPRLVFVTITGFFMGFALGHGTRLSMHLQFLSRLENFQGFSEALNNVHKSIGDVMPRGLTLLVSTGPNGKGLEVRPMNGGSGVPHGEWQKNEDNIEASMESTGRPVSSQGSAPSRDGRWDQIRAASTRTAAQSSWEAIRQSQGKARLDPAKSNGDSDQNSSSDDTETRPTSFQQDDEAQRRREEQERFDELLEAERKIGQK